MDINEINRVNSKNRLGSLDKYYWGTQSEIHFVLENVIEFEIEVKGNGEE